MPHTTMLVKLSFPMSSERRITEHSNQRRIRWRVASNWGFSHFSGSHHMSACSAPHVLLVELPVAPWLWSHGVNNPQVETILSKEYCIWQLGGVVCTLLILALERWGQEDQGFEVNLSYVISSRAAMVPRDLVLQNLYYIHVQSFSCHYSLHNKV